jgi:hypothetical protein
MFRIFILKRSCTNQYRVPFPNVLLNLVPTIFGDVHKYPFEAIFWVPLTLLSIFEAKNENVKFRQFYTVQAV